MQNSLESKFEPAVPGYATLALCFLVVLMDGFDTQTIGFNAVAIARDSGIPIAAFGPVFAAGLLGAALGAWCLGPVGDRYGRWRKKQTFFGSKVLRCIEAVERDDIAAQPDTTGLESTSLSDTQRRRDAT